MKSRWIWKVLLLLAIATGVTGFGGGAQATGAGGPSDWGDRGGETLDEVFESLDGTLEFSEFRFHGVDPKDLEIEIGERGITFSGNASITGFDHDMFQISYTVRALTESGIRSTTLRLDSDIEGGHGAVLASKKISAPRDKVPKLPWLSIDSWKQDGDRKHGDWDDKSWKGDDYKGGKSGHDGWGHKGDGFDPIGTLLAYNIAGGWVCGCGHHHESAKDVEDECGIEQASDSIDYDSERVLHILDTVKLLSFGKSEKGAVSWHSVSNEYVVTPEPGTAGLIGLGLVGLIVSERRRRGAARPATSPER